MEPVTVLNEYQQHLSIIKEALDKKEAFLFVGAGFSQNAEPKTKNLENQYKTWNGFIYQLADKLWPNDPPERIKEKISGDHLMVAQLFEEEFGKATFYEELLKAVPYKDYLPSAIHKEVITLNGKGSWAGIMTTNQDCLIEATLSERYINYDVIISDLDISTKSAPMKVFKLHGTMERPESIIFSEEQYRTYEYDHPLFHVKLKSVFAENITVFIGFSLTDPNFKSIYGWVRDILQTNYQRKAYAFVFDSDIDDYTRRYWEKRNIILLPISTIGFQDKGRAFVKGMREYVQAITEDSRLLKNKSDQLLVSDINSSISELLKKENCNQEDINRLISLLSSLKQREFLYFSELQSFFRKVYPSLDQKNKIDFLLALYPQVSPFIYINEEYLIDELILCLKLYQNLQDFDLLYQFLANKAESLFAVGKYVEVTAYVDKTLTEYPDLKVQYKNELLYWQIASEKINLNFSKIRSSINKISIDWNEPLWLNRIASTYYFIGDHFAALNYINRAIHASDQKKDDWNLYIACLSKRSLFGPSHFNKDDFYSKAEHIQNIDTIKNLNMKLKDTNDFNYEKWQEMGDLKSKWWSEYINWKESLGSQKNGFHSMRSGAISMIHYLFWFHEANGIPQTSLMEKKYDVIPDILMENHQLVETMIYGILLGFDKKMSSLFYFESLSTIPSESRLTLYQQTISFAEQLLIYMRETTKNSRHDLLENWIETLLQCWERLIPILYDTEIRGIYEKVWEFYSYYDQQNHFDYFKNVYEKLISVFSICAYFTENDSCFNRFREWSLDGINSPRKFHTLAHIDFKGLKENFQTDLDFINQLLQINNQDADKLILHLLENEILSEKQQNFIRHYVFTQHIENEKRKQLFSTFFIDKLEHSIIEKNIEEKINNFITHNSSSNVNELHELSKLVKDMKSEEIRMIQEYAEGKIRFSTKESDGILTVFTKEEITNSYLSFVIQLVFHKKASKEDLLSKLQEFPYWSEKFAHRLLELQKIENLDQEKITRMILAGLKAFDPDIRGAYCYLCGFWFNQEGILTVFEKDIVKHLLQSARDTNITVASKAINGLARIISTKFKDLSKHIIEKILEATNDALSRSHIEFLTNLAFLYNELNKLDNLENQQTEKIQEMRSLLGEFSYANVRKEIFRNKRF